MSGFICNSLKSSSFTWQRQLQLLKDIGRRHFVLHRGNFASVIRCFSLARVDSLIFYVISPAIPLKKYRLPAPEVDLPATTPGGGRGPRYQGRPEALSWHLARVPGQPVIMRSADFSHYPVGVGDNAGEGWLICAG